MDCLDCSRYLACNDDSKSYGYKCNRFELRSRMELAQILQSGNSIVHEDLDTIDLSDVMGADVLTRNSMLLVEDKINISKLIDSILAGDMLTPVDTKIDDSAVPEALNFFEFTTGENFLGVKPYVIQMLYMVMLFAEYCPRCSDTNWMMNDVKVSDSLSMFESKVQLLHKGVCPACGVGRAHLIQSGELNYYQELAGLAGQRCIVGDSVVLSPNGMFYIDDLERHDSNGQELATGYHDLEITLINGKLEEETTTRIFKCEPELIYKATLSNGKTIQGTAEHPILTDKGYKPLALCEGLTTTLPFGTEVFGTAKVSRYMLGLIATYLVRAVIDDETVDVHLSDSTKELVLREMGVDLSGKQNKLRVPKMVLRGDRTTQVNFIMALRKASQSLAQIPLPNLAVVNAVSAILQNLGYMHTIDTDTNVVTFDLRSEAPIKADVPMQIVSVKTTTVETTYDFVLPETHSFIANGIVNHNSGKSAIVAMGCAYTLHKRLKMQKPNEVYGLLRSNVIHSTFVALTYKQAAETLWEPFLSYVTDSPFFNQYHEVLDWYGRRDGDEYYKIKDTYISYKCRRLLLYPAGPNKKTLRGRSRADSAIDEIGWFDNDSDTAKVKMNANEVYVALDRSLLTIRTGAARLIRQGVNDALNGYAFNVSSPSSARDKIVELTTQARSSKKILGFKKATWEMNPNITKDDLSEEYAKDPVSAERDYGCNPPLSDSAFFTSWEAIQDCFVGNANKLTYKYAQRKLKDGTATRYAKIDRVSKSRKPNVLAIDAGYSKNSFGLALGHLHNGLPVLTCFAEVVPLPGVPLNHSLIFSEIIDPLIEERNVKVLISDRWQNIKLLQDAEMNHDDLITIAYSLKYADMWVIKQTLMDNEAVFPRLKRSIDDILNYDQSQYPQCFKDPVEHLALQIMTVRDLGNTIDKGDGLTDDIFRASCLALFALNNPELDDIFNGEDAYNAEMTASIGIQLSKGAGGGRSNEIIMSSSGSPIGIVASKRN